jgi:hypothetical protein
MASEEEPMPTSSQPAFNPANFAPGQEIDNRFMPLDAGTRFVYHTFAANGSLEQIDTVTVTSATRKLDGVITTAVHDVVSDPHTHQVLEDTLDYYAQDKSGNVWYFGEQSSGGSWFAGVNGAQPGIIMEAHPKVGDSYNQENAPGIAEDHAKVISRKGTATVPYGPHHFKHLLVTFETTSLEPGAKETKSYAAGIGEVYGKDLVTGEVDKLVSVTSNESAARLAQSMAGFGTGGAPLHASAAAEASLADLHPALAHPHHA